MSVWDEVVGQEHALAVLRQAADAARAIVDRASHGIVVDDAARSMTHAWLITGPPGFCSLLAVHGGCSRVWTVPGMRHDSGSDKWGRDNPQHGINPDSHR